MTRCGNDDYLRGRQQLRGLAALADGHRALPAEQEDGRHVDAAQAACRCTVNGPSVEDGLRLRCWYRMARQP